MEKIDHFELSQLQDLAQIVKRILELRDYDNSVNIKLKFDTTPNKEKLNICRKELKKCQKKLFNFGKEYRETIQGFIREYINSYDILVLRKPEDDYGHVKHYENFEKNWVKDFIRQFVYNMYNEENQLQYYNFDFSSIDTEKLDDAWEWHLNPKECLPLPKFNKLIKCLHTIEYFQSTWEAYHMFLKGENFDIDQMYNRKNAITGFKSNLNDDQIKRLFNSLIENYISKDTSFNQFQAIFKHEKLTHGFKIQWIDKSKTRHEPNKQTLFEFFYLLRDHDFLDKMNFDTSPSNENNLYRKLEYIFPDIKHFKNTNPHCSQKKTLRQQELEKIILSL